MWPLTTNRLSLQTLLGREKKDSIELYKRPEIYEQSDKPKEKPSKYNLKYSLIYQIF